MSITDEKKMVAPISHPYTKRINKSIDFLNIFQTDLKITIACGNPCCMDFEQSLREGKTLPYELHI